MRGDTRTEIIEATMGLLEQKKPGQLTFREIAAAAGLSHMAPYRYFRNKEDIYAVITQEGHHRLASLLLQSFDDVSRDFETQLRGAGVRYFRFAQENPIPFQLMFFENPVRDAYRNRRPRDAAGKATQGAALATFQVFLRLISKGQIDGVISKKCDLHETAVMMWSFVHGLTVLQMNTQRSVTKGQRETEKMIGEGLRALLRGLRVATET